MPPKKEKEEARIGQKVAANTAIKEQKKFMDGHKCFLAPEAKAMAETLAQENRTRDAFDIKRKNLIMPRNPLLGAQTPRQDIPGVWGEGTHILHLDNTYDPLKECPRMQIRHVGEPKRGVSDKVGSLERKYENGDSTIGLPLSYVMAKTDSLKNLQDNLSVKIDLMKATIADREKGIRKNVIKNRMTLTNYELRPGQV